MGSVTAADLVLLIDTDGDGSFNDLLPTVGYSVVSGAALVSGNIYQFSDVTGLNNDSRFTLATANCTRTPLPIELLSFNATNAKDKILLSWTTASETNNDFFQVERSLDGIQWNILDTLKGAGDSKELISYDMPTPTLSWA